MISKLRGAKESKRGIRFNPKMSITNTHVPMLEKIQESFGGRIRLGQMSCYEIHFNASEMRELLPMILPHLIVKRSQAEIMISYLDMTLELGPRPITDVVFSFYESCFQKLKDIKRIRFQHDWTPKPLKDLQCPSCGTKFIVYSNRPQKKYCNDYCKRKVCWTKSNARISSGNPAWSS